MSDWLPEGRQAQEGMKAGSSLHRDASVRTRIQSLRQRPPRIHHPWPQPGCIHLRFDSRLRASPWVFGVAPEILGDPPEQSHRTMPIKATGSHYSFRRVKMAPSLSIQGLSRSSLFDGVASCRRRVLDIEWSEAGRPMSSAGRPDL